MPNIDDKKIINIINKNNRLFVSSKTKKGLIIQDRNTPKKPIPNVKPLRNRFILVNFSKLLSMK